MGPCHTDAATSDKKKKLLQNLKAIQRAEPLKSVLAVKQQLPGTGGIGGATYKLGLWVHRWLSRASVTQGSLQLRDGRKEFEPQTKP